MKTIPSPFSRYGVTEDGDIYSLIKREPYKMKDFTDRDGYHRITLNNDSQKKKQVIISRLVYLAYVGDIPDGYQIMHLDGNKDNNHYLNLEIGTELENNKMKQEHGTQCKRESHGRAKLTEAEVAQIRADNRPHRVICKDYNVSYGLIGHIKKGRIWNEEK